MSADGLRKGILKIPENVVRPQPVTERTLMESVAGLINEVGLSTQPYNGADEKECKVLWTKIDSQPYDLKNGADVHGDSSHTQRSLMITLGYANGVQMWAIPATGEAQEVLSWKRPGVRMLKIIPNPEDADGDQYGVGRPVVLLYEGGGGGSGHNLTFLSLRSGDVLKMLKFSHPICDVKTNETAIVVSFLDKLIVIDPCKFEIRVTVATSELTGRNMCGVPSALGSTWIAFADRRLYPALQSAGGVESAVTPSYTATVLYAAKSLTKGLKGLGETVANSLGHRMPVNPDTVANSATEPGVVTVVNLWELKNGEYSMEDMACANNGAANPAVIAHFVAHGTQPVFAMRFDPSGLLVVTADKTGHDFNVFRLHPHPLGSSMGSVHHLYVLHRGDTGAKVQDISFAPDSRWVAVSTFRGTTHIFPITPYGGAISVRTHTGQKVVNRLSRFQRTAGLDDTPTSGRCSPITSTFNVSATSVGGSSKSLDLFHLGSPYPNPRYPPFSHPVVVPPLAQLRQSFMTISASPKTSPPTNKSKGGMLTAEERVYVNTVFSATRGWLLNSPPIIPSCDKRKKSLVESLFVLTSHGNLIEYSLEPIPTNTIPKDKITEDATLDLSVHATAQWTFTRPCFSKDLQPPFSSHSAIICAHAPPSQNGFSSDKSYEATDQECEENQDERWLSQVEITTHSGPHRKLWMGPQFTFKVFNTTGSTKGSSTGLGVVDVETVEVSVTNRPAKSNPVKMPASSSLIPEIFEGSSESSLEQSPSFLDPHCNLENLSLTSDSQIKENIAEAMMENSYSLTKCRSSSNDLCQNKAGTGSCEDLSSSSLECNGQKHIDLCSAPTFCIDGGFPD